MLLGVVTSALHVGPGTLERIARMVGGVPRATKDVAGNQSATVVVLRHRRTAGDRAAWEAASAHDLAILVLAEQVVCRDYDTLIAAHAEQFIVFTAPRAHGTWAALAEILGTGKPVLVVRPDGTSQQHNRQPLPLQHARARRRTRARASRRDSA